MKLLLLGILLSATALAKTDSNNDGNDFLDTCQHVETVIETGRGTPLEQFNLGYCSGFATGILESNAAYAALPNYDKAFAFCVPEDGVKPGQLIRIAVKYMKEHPEKLHLRAAVLIHVAMREAFPCK